MKDKINISNLFQKSDMIFRKIISLLLVCITLFGCTCTGTFDNRNNKSYALGMSHLTMPFMIMAMRVFDSMIMQSFAELVQEIMLDQEAKQVIENSQQPPKDELNKWSYGLSTGGNNVRVVEEFIANDTYGKILYDKFAELRSCIKKVESALEFYSQYGDKLKEDPEILGRIKSFDLPETIDRIFELLNGQPTMKTGHIKLDKNNNSSSDKNNNSQSDENGIVKYIKGLRTTVSDKINKHAKNPKEIVTVNSGIIDCIVNFYYHRSEFYENYIEEINTLIDYYTVILKSAAVVNNVYEACSYIKSTDGNINGEITAIHGEMSKKVMNKVKGYAQRLELKKEQNNDNDLGILQDTRPNCGNLIWNRDCFVATYDEIVSKQFNIDNKARREKAKQYSQSGIVHFWKRWNSSGEKMCVSALRYSEKDMTWRLPTEEEVRRFYENRTLSDNNYGGISMLRNRGFRFRKIPSNKSVKQPHDGKKNQVKVEDKVEEKKVEENKIEKNKIEKNKTEEQSINKEQDANVAKSEKTKSDKKTTEQKSVEPKDTEPKDTQTKNKKQNDESKFAVPSNYILLADEVYKDNGKIKCYKIYNVLTHTVVLVDENTHEIFENDNESVDSLLTQSLSNSMGVMKTGDLTKLISNTQFGDEVDDETTQLSQQMEEIRSQLKDMAKDHPLRKLTVAKLKVVIAKIHAKSSINNVNVFFVCDAKAKSNYMPINQISAEKEVGQMIGFEDDQILIFEETFSKGISLFARTQMTRHIQNLMGFIFTRIEIIPEKSYRNGKYKIIQGGLGTSSVEINFESSMLSTLKWTVRIYGVKTS